MRAVFACIALVASAAAKKPNIIFVMTDDQDLRLGSMQAMPYLRDTVLANGANLSNFFVHTPICCQSRSTFMSGKYVHNIKSSSAQAPGCMHMNVSLEANPEFWGTSIVPALHDLGYRTGVFGKLLNMGFGCEGAKGSGAKQPHGLDKGLIMCNEEFYNQEWNNVTLTPNGVLHNLVHTGSRPEDYTTTVAGNATLDFIKAVVGEGPGHAPFFAYFGPHAPHLPSTPPPYHVDPAIESIPVPQDGPASAYGVFAPDKHSFLADEPRISPADFAAIQQEHTNRLKSLVAVDDVVRQLAEYLKEVGEWENTYFLYTSDHGYNLGQFRVDSHKTQVYDHNARVPMIVSGPGLAGKDLPFVSSMVDIAPTLVELAGGTASGAMDGVSFAPQLRGDANAAPKTAALIEYLSIRSRLTYDLCHGDPSEEEIAEYVTAYGYRADYDQMIHGRPQVCEGALAELNGKGRTNFHPHDGPNNTFAALRILDGARDLLYAEFVDGFDPKAWDFAPSQVNFYELYNVAEDYHMLHNIYDRAPAAEKQHLHERLQAALHCRGAAQCAGLLGREEVTLTV